MRLKVSLRPRGEYEKLRFHKVIDSMLPRKAPCGDLVKIVPQTDSGRREENSKVFGRTSVKELGKITP